MKLISKIRTPGDSTTYIIKNLKTIKIYLKFHSFYSEVTVFWGDSFGDWAMPGVLVWHHDSNSPVFTFSITVTHLATVMFHQCGSCSIQNLRIQSAREQELSITI